MAVTISGLCCDCWERNSDDDLQDLNASVRSIEDPSERKRAVNFFRCLGIFQLFLGGGLLACGIVIIVSQAGWYSWGSFAVGIMVAANGIFCLLATCRGLCDDEYSYKRFASCQLRANFGLSMFVMAGLSLPAIITTGIGGVGTCNDFFDDCKNYDTAKNASIAAIVLMIMSILSGVAFIYLSCVFGERFGMAYDIQSKDGVTRITTMGPDEIDARNEARRNQAHYNQAINQQNQLLDQQLNAEQLLQQQQQQYNYMGSPPPPIPQQQRQPHYGQQPQPYYGQQPQPV